MKAVIKQNGETRICDIIPGQKVKHPKGFWGHVLMIGEDNSEPPLPRILMNHDGFVSSKKEGVYPDELQLLEKDFIKGEKIF